MLTAEPDLEVVNLEGLDFEVCCQAIPDGVDECDRPAVWFLRYKPCGHVRVWCEEHTVAMRAEFNDRGVFCAECGRPVMDFIQVPFSSTGG